MSLLIPVNNVAGAMKAFAAVDFIHAHLGIQCETDTFTMGSDYYLAETRVSVPNEQNRWGKSKS